MPLVTVNYNPDKIGNPAFLKGIGEILGGLVANALTCDDDGGQLKAEDVEVQFRERSPLDCGGEQYGLTVTVFANYYPTRQQNLTERVQTLNDELQIRLKSSGVSGFIWVFLGHAAFLEF